MSSAKDNDTSLQAALAALEAMASRSSASRSPAPRPSPASRFNFDGDGPAKRAATFRALQQRFQRLNEYCDEAAAAIRASLERPPTR